MSSFERPSSGNMSLSGCVIPTPDTTGCDEDALTARFATRGRPRLARFPDGVYDLIEIRLFPHNFVHHLRFANDLLGAIGVHTRQHERAAVERLRVAKKVEIAP